jgi:D-cysteine desulfhydrase
MSLALFRAYPALAERLPSERLVGAVTPVEEVAALGAWVKRDDLTAAPLGGNKVRKLELLLADARARGHRALLTVGGTGSNHVLATAIYARRLGFAATHAVLFPQPECAAVTLRLAQLRELGVETTRAGGKLGVPLAAARRVAAALARGQGRPYVIGPGGSSPLGSLGYVGAALELAEQVRAGVCPAPRAIYVPLGSGGTAAGLLVGLALAGLDGARVVAVQVVPWPWASEAAVRGLARRTAALLLRLGVRAPAPGALEVVRDQLGPGYGAPTAAAEAAVARAAAAGLTLETTYSGKALAALLARREPGALFWLTYAEPRS